MGKGNRPARFRDSNKISEQMGKVEENEKINPTLKIDKLKEKKVNKDGSTRYVY